MNDTHQGIDYRRPRFGNGYTRSPKDYYTEPDWAVELLFNNERFMGNIWDPAAGSRTIGRVCDARGFDTISSDLIHRGIPSVDGGIDFFETTSIHDYYCPVDNVICNPPFNLAEKFIRRALEVSRFKAAFLLRLSFLESVTRSELFDTTPLARVHVFRQRVSMPPGGSEIEAKGGAIAFAWFVWNQDHQGPPAINWLERVAT